MTMVRSFIFALLLQYSVISLADTGEITHAIEIDRMYRSEFDVKKFGRLPDPFYRKEIITRCVDRYVAQQSRTYAKRVQHNIYDLMKNIDKISAKVYGKPVPKEKTTYLEKLEVVAQVQCEAYYTMGVLK